MNILGQQIKNHQKDELGNNNDPLEGQYIENWLIELRKGNAVIYREGRNNKIRTTKTQIFLLIPYTMMESLLRVGNIFYLIISLIMLANDDLSPYLHWIMIFPLGIYTLVYIIKEIAIELEQRKEDRRINSMKTRRSQEKKDLFEENVDWEKLKPGDVVMLKRGEICPADMIILDTSLTRNRENVCWVDSQGVDGFESYTLKKSLQATRTEKNSSKRGNWAEFRKMLYGKVEYDPPDRHMTTFKGYIRLKKDPRPENLTLENMIQRGSIIQNVDWVYGLCIYTGHDCKIMKNTNYTKNKRSYFEKQIEGFYAFGIFLIVLMSGISSVVIMSRVSETAIQQTEENVNGLKYFYFLVLYSPYVPISLYPVYDLILLIKRARIQNLKCADGSKANVRVFDPSTLPNLGQVDYCFLDKTGTLTTGNYKVKGVFIPQQLYGVSQEEYSMIPQFMEKRQKTRKIETPLRPTRSDSTNMNSELLIESDQKKLKMPTSELKGFAAIQEEDISAEIQSRKESLVDEEKRRKSITNLMAKLKRDDPALDSNAGIQQLISPSKSLFSRKDIDGKKNSKSKSSKDSKSQAHTTPIIEILGKESTQGGQGRTTTSENKGTGGEEEDSEPEPMKLSLGFNFDTKGDDTNRTSGNQNSRRSNHRVHTTDNGNVSYSNKPELSRKDTQQAIQKTLEDQNDDQPAEDENSIDLGLKRRETSDAMTRARLEQLKEKFMLKLDSMKAGEVPQKKPSDEAVYSKGDLTPSQESEDDEEGDDIAPMKKDERLDSVVKLESKSMVDSLEVPTTKKQPILSMKDIAMSPALNTKTKEGRRKSEFMIKLWQKFDQSTGVEIGQKMLATPGVSVVNIEREIIKKVANFDTFLNHLHTEQKAELNTLMKCLAVCHSSRSNHVNEDYQYESATPDENAILKFAKDCGCAYIKANKIDNPTEYTIKQVGAIRENVRILGINDWTYSRKRFSIVCTSEDFSQAQLYVKGPAQSMKGVLNLSEFDTELFDRVVNKYQEKGQKVVVYAKKVLSLEEADKFCTKYQNVKMSLYGQQSDLEDLAKQIEKNLELTGIIALEDELQPDAKQVISTLTKADIKPWIITGDNKQNALDAGYMLELLNKKHDFYNIKVEHKDDAKAMLRSILNKVKKTYFGDDTMVSISKKEMYKRLSTGLTTRTMFDENKYKFVIAIDGASLDLLFKDSYLKANFTFICSLCHCFIGYMFSPTQKKAVVNMVKNNFMNKPITMAIGDGLNDAMMLSSAHVGISLKAREGLLPSYAGDIQIDNLKILEEVLLIHGRNISDKIEKTIHHQFYTAIALGMPIFYFNWYSSFTGTAFFDSMFVFLYSFLFCFIPILSLGMASCPEPEGILRKFPALYIDGKLQKQRVWKNFLIQTYMEGILHSVLTFYFSIYIVGGGVNDKGQAFSLWTISVLTYYVIVFCANWKIYFLMRRGRRYWFGGFVLSVFSVLIYIVINESSDFIPVNYYEELGNVFEQGIALFCLLWELGACCALSYLLRHYVIEKFYPSVYHYYAHKISIGQIRRITNEDILNKFTRIFDLGGIIKSVFKQTETMDPAVLEMLSPADQSAADMGINKFTLQFLDRRMERSFKLKVMKESYKFVRSMYFILLFAYVIYAIVEAARLNDTVYTFSRLGVVLGFVIFGILLTSKLYRVHFYEITFIGMFCALIVKIAYDWTNEADTSLAAALIPLVASTVFNISSFYAFILNCFHLLNWIIRMAYLATASHNPTELPEETLVQFYVILSYILLLSEITALISYLGYRFEKEQREEHSSNAKLEIQMSKHSGILSILLPKFIKDKMDKFGGNNRALAEDQGEVTILFCDIMDFDKMIKIEGKRVVQILDNIFRGWDQYAASHGCQKIETVGKTYMACAGLASCEANVPNNILAINSTRRILNMAIDMEDFVKRFTYGDGLNIKIRIGIHSGKVIAGVIGYHKPQFSLIGDTVNTTSRVCTAGNNGQIRLSDEAHQRITNAGGTGNQDLYFIPKLQEMKGKGEVKVHILTKKATNNAFRSRIGSAIKKGKEKGIVDIFSKLSKKNKSSEAASEDKPKNSTVEDIKQLVQRQERMERMNSAQARVVLEQDIEKDHNQSPNQSFTDRIREEIPEDDFGIEDDHYLVRPSKFMLRFPTVAKYKRKPYEEFVRGKMRVFHKVSLVSLFISYALQTSIMIIIRQYFENDQIVIAFRVVFLLLFLTYFLLSQFLIKRNIAHFFIIVIFASGTIISLAQAITTEVDSFHKIQLYEVMLIYLTSTHAVNMDFTKAVVMTAYILSCYFILFGAGGLIKTENLFFMLVIAVINLIQVHGYFKKQILFYNWIQYREKKKLEQSSLVGQLLPPHAVEKLFSEIAKADVGDKFENVTLIYADIKGFTNYSASVESKDVVNMLSALFTKFDQMCVKYSLYKVYTIGDCYVATSFIDASKRDPQRDAPKEALNMVKMALSMIEIIREVRKEINYDDLDMRIGIHTGTIIGGIVGTEIVRYDIYGPDVIIANAMESEGEKGNINVSETTRNLLERNFPGIYKFEPHKVVELDKIETKMPSYLLYANEEEDSIVEG